MKITLLGTGGADGWPNPFCGCDSCVEAAGAPRVQTCALVDDRLLLELGPQLPVAAVLAGVSLVDVEGVLVTHAHDDHLDAANLLYRGWVSQRPLVLAGPEAVLEVVQPWLAPGQDIVRGQALRAGEAAEVIGYQVAPVAANHMHWSQALVYGISDGQARVAWLTDTGLLDDEALLGLTALGGLLDLVLLEETFGDLAAAPEEHHDLARFEATLAQMQRLGLVGAGTQVVAVHLAHHNPGPAVLEARLAGIGERLGLAVSAGRDGQVLQVG